VRKLPTQFGSPDESPGYQLWRVTNIWQRRIAAALKDLNLTHVQFVLLAVCTSLSERDEFVNQAKIAEGAGTDKMMTSEVLRTLESKGFLVRSRHPSDARAFALTVTDAGFSAVSEAIARVEAADAAFFAPLGEDAGVLARLLRGLVSG